MVHHGALLGHRSDLRRHAVAHDDHALRGRSTGDLGRSTATKQVPVVVGGGLMVGWVRFWVDRRLGFAGFGWGSSWRFSVKNQCEAVPLGSHQLISASFAGSPRFGHVNCFCCTGPFSGIPIISNERTGKQVKNLHSYHSTQSLKVWRWVTNGPTVGEHPN